MTSLLALVYKIQYFQYRNVFCILVIMILLGNQVNRTVAVFMCFFAADYCTGFIFTFGDKLFYLSIEPVFGCKAANSFARYYRNQSKRSYNQEYSVVLHIVCFGLQYKYFLKKLNRITERGFSE